MYMYVPTIGKWRRDRMSVEENFDHGGRVMDISRDCAHSVV